MTYLYAEEQDLLFLPKGNMQHNGHQLYSFGGVPTFLENDLVYAQDEDGDWVPAGLEELAERALKRKTKK